MGRNILGFRTRFYPDADWIRERLQWLTVTGDSIIEIKDITAADSSNPQGVVDAGNSLPVDQVGGPSEPPGAGSLSLVHVHPSNASSSSEAERPCDSPSPSISSLVSPRTFTYEELAEATDQFSRSNLLGHGGFADVYKGKLPDGKVVAVKKLNTERTQGECDFRAEIKVISKVNHKNLVCLVGYCVSGAQRLLVFEFVPNKTREYHLRGEDRTAMDWSTRLKIAIGCAKALVYLHEECKIQILHRDIKAANILLDDNFEVKVADFGLAKILSDTQTHVSTRPSGTFGYKAPEYALHMRFSKKSDVYSFGVVLLELTTGEKPIDESFEEWSLVERAKPLLSQALENGNFNELADPCLGENYNRDEFRRMIACAARCVQPSAEDRPGMSQVLADLEGRDVRNRGEVSRAHRCCC